MGCGASQGADKDNSSQVTGHFLSIPQKDTAEGKAKRSKQLQEAKRSYEIEYSDWLPPSTKGIPERELGRPEASFLLDLFAKLHGESMLMKFLKPVHMIEKFVRCEDPTAGPNFPFQQWIEIYPPDMTFDGVKHNIPSVSTRWREDREFGYQRLNGINPIMVKRYRPLPNFPVTDELLAGVLPPGQTIASLHEAKRLYMLDFQWLQGVSHPPEVHWVVPIVLLLIDDSKELVPIAIQLHQSPLDGPIYTPKVHPGCWQLVKWYCTSADAAMHQNVSHLLSTHLIMETVYLVAHRNLAERHPIHELIDAHFWFTVIINTSARNKLMVPEGQLPKLYPQGLEGMQQLMGKFNHEWDWEKYDIPKFLASHDVAEIPGYHYRDDALKLWPVVQQYVQEIVDLTYANDAEVNGDPELEAMARELQIGTTWKNLPMTGGKFTTKEELVRFVTLVIFNVSCQHAAVNNGQFDFIGYVPNCPPKLSIPPPTLDAQFTDVELARALPNYDSSIVQVAFFGAIASPCPVDRRLGAFPQGYMTELPNARPAIQKFQRQLSDISKDIKVRNASLRVPYTYLDPEQIATGVAT